MGLLDGKSGIVTGAAQGFGLATAKRLAEEGASVALVDIKADKVNAAAASLVSEGLNANSAYVHEKIFSISHAMAHLCLIF